MKRIGLVALNAEKDLTVSLATLLNGTIIPLKKQVFFDQECVFEINQLIEYDLVYIVAKTISAPEVTYFHIGAVADLLRRNGVQHIHLIAPYLSFSRQINDKNHQTNSFILSLQLLKHAGISRIFTLDFHNPLTQVPLEIHNIKTQPYLKEFISPTAKMVVISPDHGGSERAETLAHALGVDAKSFRKVRDENGIKISFAGTLPYQSAVIVDDILSSGETIKEAVLLLHKSGIKEITLVITHLVEPQVLLKLMQEFEFRNVFVFNSLRKPLLEQVNYLVIDKLFYDAIKGEQNE
ncbi:MAG: ribose-phosphate diphosphokinase [Erysipelotrichaceae bacterium]|jgi:ribose-phosphate pyrophosphokinase|nr:ribose-phosphate diphosphokinase [Erysipelotrichaceae bacterium]